jgi:hypothetical protein
MKVYLVCDMYSDDRPVAIFSSWEAASAWKKGSDILAERKHNPNSPNIPNLYPFVSGLTIEEWEVDAPDEEPVR